MRTARRILRPSFPRLLTPCSSGVLRHTASWRLARRVVGTPLSPNVLSARFGSAVQSSKHLPELAPAEQYDKHYADLFRAAALEYSSLVALEGPHAKFTYAELDAVTDKLAAFLRINYRAAPETVVGIYMERCEDYVIALLAIWKAGAAYVPIELAYPSSLLEAVLDEVAPSVVLTKSAYNQNLPLNATTFLMDDDWQQAVQRTSPNLAVLEENKATLDNLGYVVMSGGSTGRPKGIEAPFRSPQTSYLWRYSISGYQPGARVGCNVFFVWEVLRPLLRGGTTVVIPDDIIFDSARLFPYLKSKEISEVLFTPSLFEALLHATEPAMLKSLPLEVVWLNGEVNTTKLLQTARDLLPNVKFNTTYSISECGEVCAGLLDADRPDCPKFCPVGKMADFVSHRLVDTETGTEVKKGEAGELWVSGPGVGRGYTKNPAKTAEAFVTHQGTPYYRTGDLARELHDGVMEILGRCDFMVKVRGYSVVLGAVEAAIKKLVGVAQVCVVAQGEEGTDKRIAAYFCESGPAELRGRMPVSTAAIDDYGRSPVLFQELLKELPHYAVPSVFIKIKTMPLNKASTKTDRFALPPLPAQPPSAAIAADFSYDGSEAASRLVFEEVLKLPEGTLTTESNFFEFGGHSLLVTHLLSRVHALGGPRVPVADFIRAPTVAGLSRLARGEASPTEPARFLPSEVEKHSGGMTGVSLAVKAYWNFIVFSNSSQRVLLTGATGYVGAHILNKLMRSSQSQVFCLVRGPRDYKGNETDREVARSRLIAHLGAHGLSSELDMDRLQVVVGDVGLPHLGMDTDDYRYLQQMVDVVIHTAANVNLAYNYDVLESINTQGTANAIDFARGGKVKALHYVSTNGIFPESGPAASFAETDIPPHHLLQTGYGQTKWVAERLVAKAAQLGLPTVTYRLGNVAGPSQGMGWNDKDSNLLFMRACLDNGAVPGGDWSIELTPVDFIAQFIVNCMMDIKFANNKTFHLINSSKLPLNLLARVAAGKGFPITRPTPSSWCGELSDSEGLLSVVLGDEALESLLGRHHTYLQSNIEAACAHFGMSYPRASEELLSGYVDRLVAENLLPGPPNAGGLRLGGRVAVVTGASTGIGLGVARALVAEGATVVLVDGSAENLKAISGQLGGTTYFPCDVTSRKSVHSTITDVQSSLGRIDILVNCAGAMHQTTTESRLYDDEWEDMVDMNCKGVMNVCGATFPMMLKAKKGHIVNISSDSGKTLPALTVYNASKAFVSAFSKGLRAESAGSGLRITDVQSGPANQSDSAGACLEPEDVASAVIYAVTSPSHMGLHEMLIEAR